MKNITLADAKGKRGTNQVYHPHPAESGQILDDQGLFLLGDSQTPNKSPAIFQRGTNVHASAPFSGSLAKSQAIQENYGNSGAQGAMRNQLSHRGTSGGSGDHNDVGSSQMQVGTIPGGMSQSNQDSMIYKGGAKIINSKIVNAKESSGPGMQPGHHKANSMQISSKHKAQQLLLQQPSPMIAKQLTNAQPTAKQSTSNISSQHARANQPQPPQKSHSKNPSQIYFNQKGSNIKNEFSKKNRKNVRQTELTEDSMRNNSEGVTGATAPNQLSQSNYGYSQIGKKQPKVILSNAVEQQMHVTSQANETKNSHIVMNTHHVKMKSGVNKGSIQTTQVNLSPMQEERKVIGNPETVQSMPHGQHKKANSLMNQKMMQLLLAKDQGGAGDHQGPYVIGQERADSIINQEYTHMQPVSGATLEMGQPIGVTADISRQGQTYHAKSKSLMQNNEFIGVSADNTSIKKKIITQSRPIISSNIKLVKKANNFAAGQTNNSTMANQHGQYTISHIPGGMKSKGISYSFDKTAKQVVNPAKARSYPTGTQEPPSAQHSIIASSTQNLHQVQNTGAKVEGQHHINYQRGDAQSNASKGLGPAHHRTRSDAQNFKLQGSNAPSKNSIVISSVNHVYPHQGQNHPRTQSKKASNVRSMNHNNQVSGQGATKGLLKYTQQQIQTPEQTAIGPTGARANKLARAFGGHKKNQYSTIVKSSYQNLVGNHDQNAHQNDNQIGAFEKADQQSQKVGLPTANPMIDLEIFNSSQNKTTEQKYEELKLKYDDLLSKHFALAAQRTEDLREPKKPSGHGARYQSKFIQASGMNEITSNMMGVNKIHGQANTTQQTLEPPQIIMNEIRNQGTLQTKLQSGEIGEKGGRGSKGSTRQVRPIRDNGNNQHDEVNSNMVQIINEANGAAEAELNMIIGGSASGLSGGGTNGQINTVGQSNQQSQNHTPRGNEQSMMYMGSVNESIAGFTGAYSKSFNPKTTKNERIPTEDNSQNVSSTNFAAQSDQQQYGQFYQLNLRGSQEPSDNRGQVSGKNSSGSTIVSRTEAMGPLVARQSQHFSDDITMSRGPKGFSKQKNVNRPQQYGAGTSKTFQNNKNHKRSVSDGGIFNNIGLKAKAMQVIGGLKDFTGVTGPAYVNTQQQIPTKDKSIQNSQKSFEMRINEMRSANGLPTHDLSTSDKMKSKPQVSQNTRYLQQNMMILEEGDDEREDRTNTHNTIISQESQNEENIRTEMGQEHSAEFSLNPHASMLEQQNDRNMLQIVRQQSKGRQQANSSNMSYNSRAVNHKSQFGAAYQDGFRMQPGQMEQAFAQAAPQESLSQVKRDPVLSKEQPKMQRIKQKQTKSLIMGTNMATLDSEDDLNSNAAANRPRKQRQMRMSGDQGLSKLQQERVFQNDVRTIHNESVALLENEGIQQKNATKKQAVNHRRGKSGASEQIAGKSVISVTDGGSVHQGKVILFKNNEKTQKKTVKQNQISEKQQKTENQVNEKQRSAKNLLSEKEHNPVSNNKFMLIYEDEEKAPKHNELSYKDQQNIQQQQIQEGLYEDPEEDPSVEFLQQMGDTGAFEPFNQNQNNNKKVINVSFNDFNQSMSHEYDERDFDGASKEQRDQVDQARSNFLKQGGIQDLGQNQSSNKNLNSFLQALSKIKPQNPVNGPGSGAKKKYSLPEKNIQMASKQGVPSKAYHKKMKSEMILSQQAVKQLPQDVEHTKITSMSGNPGNQLRLEKYQKMMQKVKQNDKQLLSKSPVLVLQGQPGQNHNRIKSTNIDKIGADNSAYQFDGRPSLGQANARREGNYSVDARGSASFKKGSMRGDTNQKKSARGLQQFDNAPEVSQGFDAGSGQSSEKNLKITFVGDRALIKQQRQVQRAQGSSMGNEAPWNAKDRIQFHQSRKAPADTNLNTNNNTGGQPSPIISTKRVPQKILSHKGEGLFSPMGNRAGFIKQNNFIGSSSIGNNHYAASHQNQSSVVQREIPHQRDSDNSLKPKQKAQPSQGMLRKKQPKQAQDLNQNQLSMPNNIYSGQNNLNIQENSSQNQIQMRAPDNQLQEDDQVNLIQNLNKFSYNNLDDERDDETQELIHIINHPVPSLASKKGQAQSLLIQAPQVSERQERLVTEESNCAGAMTPRSKNIRKLIKLIKLGFRQNPPIPPDTTIDFYRIGKILGKGAFGKVNLAVHKLSQCLCAVKSINKQFFSDDSQTKKVMQEVVMLKKTRHQNIVRLYEYFETEKHILFVIELCAGGDLLNYVRRRRRLKEDVAKCLFKQIIESLAYCHSKSILHRDIKLDNILLDANGQVKICDFGVGKIVKKGEKMTEQCGTPAYIAPEILRDQGYYGFKVDIWSAGVVLYAMLYGTVPFKANNMTELQKIIMKAKYSLKEDISEDSRNLLRGLLEKDPAKRLNISQILGHTWLQDAADAADIELFTEQERQYIKSEFSYGKSSRYDRNIDMPGHGRADPIGMSSMPGILPQSPEGNLSELEKDMFTEHALDSTQNSLMKNCETKSVILAPFNSTKSNLPEPVEGEDPVPIELSDSIKALIEPSKIIKFGPRVRDIDKQYEINNNADLDNGVYHKFDEDENNEGNGQESNQQEDEVEQENLLDEPEYDMEEREILQQLRKQGQKKAKQSAAGKKKQSELERLEDMIHDQEEKEKQTIREDNIGDHDGMDGNLVTQNSNQQIFNPQQNTENSIISSSPGPSPARPGDNHKMMNIIEGSGAMGPAPNTEESFISSVGYNQDPRMIQLYQSQAQNEVLPLDEDIMNNVIELGYPRAYLEKCLGQNELNYATTSYWLLYFAKRIEEIGEKWERGRLKKDQIGHEVKEADDGQGLKLELQYSNGQIISQYSQQ